MERNLRHSMKKQDVRMRDDAKKVHFSEQSGIDQRKRQIASRNQSAKKSRVSNQLRDIYRADELISSTEFQLRGLDEKLETTSTETVKLFHFLGEIVCDLVEVDNGMSVQNDQIDGAVGLLTRIDGKNELYEMGRLCEDTVELDMCHLEFIECLDKAVSFADEGKIACLQDHLTAMERSLKKLTVS